jgi:hypothetical protein
MLNANRFDKFAKTNLYLNFGDCLTWNKEIVDINDLEFYKNNLEYLLSTFQSTYEPNEDQINWYVENNEYIEDEDVEEFIIFIKVIFEKSYETHHACRLLSNKNIITEKKNIVKDKINNDKQSEKEEQRRIKREQKELEKERKKKELEIYNNQIIKCKCGLTYVRIKKIYHMSSTKHETRMETIKWLLQPHVLKEYTSNNMVFDTESPLQSINGDDDNSSISSKGSIS